ncbi:MAG: di-heme oxidoredictase family protein [Dokdonella sp.]
MNVMPRQNAASARVCIGFALFTLLPCTTQAQLTDVTQTTPHIAGGAIGKSLQQQIGTGRGDDTTPSSSLYLIARDPARAVRRGRQVFQRKFTLEQGIGPRVNFDSSGDIMANAALGAGFSDSCASCHGRPRGAAGFGGDVVTRPDSRNAPHLFGAGLREMLADEITSDLRALRSRAERAAATSHMPISLPLISKGVHYGSIKALPDHTFDTSRVEGVNADLRVRPFFAEGREFSLRGFAVGAFNDEMGMQSADPVLCAASDPTAAVVVTTPAGLKLDPALDTIKRPPTCDATADVDGDGVVNEIDPALLDYMETYLLNYFKPGIGRTTARSDEGRALMDNVGCTSCHVADFTIKQDRRVADLETRYDSTRGIFNQLYASATTLFNVVADGDPYPKLLPKLRPFLVSNLFTDFKRHDLGAAFHERNYDGNMVTLFMTSPLWGVGTKAPYAHDGRSVTLRDVIVRHDGEAAAAKNAFVALGDDGQAKIVEFLQTLVLFPPDDTASDLNPGHPGSSDPQDPTQHGSIALSALFQIASEGAE